MSAAIVVRCKCKRFVPPGRVHCACGKPVKNAKLKLWYVDLQGEHARPGSKRTRVRVGLSTNAVAAIARREQLVTEATTAKYIRADLSGRFTLQQLSDWYLERAETKLLKSYSIAKIQLANIVSGIGAGKALSELDIADVADYRDRRLTAGIAPATINKEVGQLTAALNAATRGKKHGTAILFRNPIAGMRKLPENNARDFTIGTDDLDMLIAGCRDIVEDGAQWLAPMVEAAFFSLMREGELCALTPDRVFLDDDLLKLRGIDTKTKAARIVTLHPRTKRALRSTKANWLRTGRVFSRADGRRVTPKMVQAAFRRVVDKLELSHLDYGRLHFHDLRHSGTEYYQSLGSPDRAIMSLGGWTSDAMLRRYASKSQVKLQAGLVMEPPRGGRGKNPVSPADTRDSAPGRK